MTPLRRASFLLTAALVAATAGCRTAGVGDLTRRDSLPARDGESAADLLVDHNRNAEKVQSIEARPNIKVADRRSVFGVDGRLAVEKPRNFKLVLSGPVSDVADIGSNDKEFWFWVKENRDQAVYFCNYNENGTSPLAASFQPDWIVEALGLRAIPDDEAATIKVTPGEPGTWLLTQKQTTGRGETTYKETVLSAATKRILKHRVYAADHKTLLTEATITEYDNYAVPGEPGRPAGVVYLPKTFRLKWEQEKLSLNVALSKVQVNAFDPSRRAAIFVEPALAGIGRKDLARLAGATSPSRATLDKPATSVRESLPAPPPRIRLSDPAPIGIDGAVRLRRDPTALAAAARTRAVEDVVGPLPPTAEEPVPDAVPTQNGWRNAVER